MLTAAAYNGSSPDFVAAYVTSQPQTSQWSVPLTQQNLQDGRLVQASWIRTDRLATVEQRLDEATLAQLRT